MNKKNLLAILAVVVLVSIVAGLYFFKRPKESGSESNLGPITLTGQFAGADSANISADAQSMNRVIRGYFDSTAAPENPYLLISTQINWPQEEPLRLQTVKMLPQTEYLCWPASFVTGDGTTAYVKDTVYLIDFDSKLFAPGQKPLSYDEAMGVIQKGSPVIVLLQQPFSLTGENTAFQLAIVGCQ